MFRTIALLSGGFSIKAIQDSALWEQGLFVVIAGLVGVFLVLTLFFFTIVVMQKIAEAAKHGKKQEDSEEA